MPRHAHASPRSRAIAVLLLIVLAATRIGAAQPDGPTDSRGLPGNAPGAELWAYLLDGEEKLLAPDATVTDLAYFGAGLSSLGKLVGVPSRAKLAAYKGRIHLVVAETSSQALSHFALDPAYPLRDALVADIVKAAEAFDGVQIDFETVPPADYDNFHAFLGLLKAGLGQKRLSVALPARMSEGQDKIGYERTARVADRVIVMAYDEHWSSSEPGPVASLSWCKSVADYALRKIGPEKLVMGLPFYGRAWADRSLAKAYRYSGVAGLIADKGIGAVQRVDSVPFFEYEETVKVRLYFDDAVSILARLDLYRRSGVSKAAFWRIGQEDPATWRVVAAFMAPAADPVPAVLPAQPSAQPGAAVPTAQPRQAAQASTAEAAASLPTNPGYQ